MKQKGKNISTKKTMNYISSFSLKLYNLCQRMPFLRYLKIVLYFTDSFLLFFIKKPKYNDRNKKKVFVIYNYAFGDGVIWMNVARQLRKIYPIQNYEITLICQKGINMFYENEKVFDKVVSYDLTKSTYNLRTRFKLYKLLRSEYYDIVIDPIGVYECTTNIFMSRAIVSYEKITILDVTLNNRMCPRWLSNKIYDKVIEITRPNLSLLEFYAELIRGLSSKKYKVSLHENKKNNLSMKIPEKYFIIFPSASTLLKRWPVENYAKLSKLIYNKTKLPLLLCGTSADIDSINEFKSNISDIPIHDIVGKTTILEFIEVIKRATFVVTNDTSTYHIAVINQTPVAIITGGYTYDRYVSYNFENMNNYRKPCIIVKNDKCFNCDNKCTRLKKDDKIWPCLADVSLDYAWKKIEKYIDENNIGG